jgi:hypothetical protein
LVRALGGKHWENRPLISSDPSIIDTSFESRAATFENPTAARGAGGSSFGGRKGSPSRRLGPGENATLLDIDGPGTVRRLWMTFPPASPQTMRAMWMEVYYDGMPEPSVSVPCLDFFGLPHGRPRPYASALTSAQEGRGFNAYFPMPFRRHIRIVLTNGSARPMDLYYQADLTLGDDIDERAGYLHAAFRRQNPTTMREDFVIVEGIEGPGRFLGCCVGVRVIDPCAWYGEGEVKVFLDGDTTLPTICGTGLEDYVGSAWGMGPHHAPYAGVPVYVKDESTGGANPDFVGFYRWHLPDPVVFKQDLRVTIQQIGFARFNNGEMTAFEAYNRANPPAGRGWTMSPAPGILAYGIAERVDDFCATAFVYARTPQPVPRLDVAGALADVARLDYERSGGATALPGAALPGA